MPYKLACVALGSLLFVAPASAHQSPQSNTVTPKAPEKTYCLQFSLDTGSRINRVECKTKKQWALLGVDVDHLTDK